MGRPLETPGVRLDQRIHIPVSDKMIAYLDRVKGEKSRAAYVRELVRKDAITKEVTGR